jgi:hypothetical protein
MNVNPANDGSSTFPYGLVSEKNVVQSFVIRTLPCAAGGGAAGGDAGELAAGGVAPDAAGVCAGGCVAACGEPPLLSPAGEGSVASALPHAPAIAIIATSPHP